MLEKIVKIDGNLGSMSICVPGTKEIMDKLLSIPGWQDLSSAEQSKITASENEKVRGKRSTSWYNNNFNERFQIFSKITKDYLTEQQSTFDLYEEVINVSTDNNHTRIYSNNSIKKILSEDMLALYKTFIEFNQNEYQENLSHVFYIMMLSMFLDSENEENFEETFENFVIDNTDKVERIILGKENLKIRKDILKGIVNHGSDKVFCFLPSKYSTLQNIKMMGTFTRKEYQEIVIIKDSTLSKKSKGSSEFAELVKIMKKNLSGSGIIYEYPEKTLASTSFLYNVILNKSVYEYIIYTEGEGKIVNLRINYLNKAISDASESNMVSQSEEKLIINELNWLYGIIEEGMQQQWFDIRYITGFIMFLKMPARIVTTPSSMSLKNFINEIRHKYEILPTEVFAQQMNNMMKMISEALSSVFSTPFGKVAKIEDLLDFMNSDDLEDIPIEIISSLYFPKKGKTLVKKDALDELLIEAIKDR